ncbi:hypothetical protein V8G54_013546, partial [Vigna mungo]
HHTLSPPEHHLVASTSHQETIFPHHHHHHSPFDLNISPPQQHLPHKHSSQCPLYISSHTLPTQQYQKHSPHFFPSESNSPPLFHSSHNTQDQPHFPTSHTRGTWGQPPVPRQHKDHPRRFLAGE